MQDYFLHAHSTACGQNSQFVASVRSEILLLVYFQTAVSELLLFGVVSGGLSWWI